MHAPRSLRLLRGTAGSKPPVGWALSLGHSNFLVKLGKPFSRWACPPRWLWSPARRASPPSKRPRFQPPIVGYRDDVARPVVGAFCGGYNRGFFTWQRPTVGEDRNTYPAS
jgi:hypothetical protein